MMEERKMKKELKYIVLASLLALYSLTVQAQIYIMDDEEAELSQRSSVENIGEIPIPPINLDSDWIPGNYAPLGDDPLLLIFGGAYIYLKLMKKGKVKNNTLFFKKSDTM